MGPYYLLDMELIGPYQWPKINGFHWDELVGRYSLHIPMDPTINGLANS